MFVSQSGETADTLATLRYAKASGQHVLSIVNVRPRRSPARATCVMPTSAGPEIGVASTKAFTCQLAALACLAIAAGRARGDAHRATTNTSWSVRCVEVPRLMAEALALEPTIERLARDLAKRAGRALPRPRDELPAGARRRAQAQGNLLHSCRGLCGGRTEAWADRADRRDDAGHRHRAYDRCSKKPSPTCKKSPRAGAASF